MTSISLGEVIYMSCKPMFKIYFLIGVGFWLARKNILSVDTTKNISSIAIMVTMPALLFNKIVTNIDNSDIAQIGTIAFLGIFNMLGGGLMCFLAGLITRCPKRWYGGLISVGMFPNISDLPIAYLQSLESSGIVPDVDRGVAFNCIYTVIQLIGQFNCGLYKLIEWDFRDAFKNAGDKKPADEEQTVSTSASPESIQHTNCSNSLTSISSSVDENDTDENQPHSLREKRTGRRSSWSTARRSLDLRRTESACSGTSLREMPTENMADMVRQYSRFDELATGSVKVNDPADLQVAPKTTPSESKGVWPLAKSFIFLLLDSFRKPISLTVVISLIICMIPWVKALFVTTNQAHISPAPDGLPPLSFMMDISSYIGAAQVPFGLLILGATIGRLEIRDIPLSRWRTPLAVTSVRLVLLPIVGCALDSKVNKDGLFYNEPILHFVSNIVFCMPPATSNIYLTAFYTPPDYEDHIQVDCLALAYICHYVALVVCLPFTAAYTLKVPLKY